MPEQRRRAVICLPPDNPDAIVELVPMAVDALAEQEAKEVEEEAPKFAEVLGDKPYILVRITGDVDEEHVSVDFETGGGFDQKTGMEFLKELIAAEGEN